MLIIGGCRLFASQLLSISSRARNTPCLVLVINSVDEGSASGVRTMEEIRM